MYLAKNHTDFSTSKIGKFIGNKDHATVLHACKTVKGQLEVDKSFSAEVQEIESLLKRETEIKYKVLSIIHADRLYYAVSHQGNT